MPACFRDAVQHIRAQLVSQRLKLGTRKLAQVSGAVDGFKQLVHCGMWVDDKSFDRFTSVQLALAIDQHVGQPLQGVHVSQPAGLQTRQGLGQ